MAKAIFQFIFIFIVGCVNGTWDLGKALIPTKDIQIKGVNCDWNPAYIDLEKNTHVILEIESLDFAYNFHMNDFNLDIEIPAKGKRIAEFYSPDTSRYKFDCFIDEDSHPSERLTVAKLVINK